MTARNRYTAVVSLWPHLNRWVPPAANVERDAKIRQLLATGVSGVAVGERFGISRARVCQIRHAA